MAETFANMSDYNLYTNSLNGKGKSKCRALKLTKKISFDSYLLCMSCQTRNRSRLEDIIYAINLYFDCGLSSRKTSQALSYLHIVKRSHTAAIIDWIQKYKPKKISSKSKRISEFIVDEILLKVGS